MTSKNIKNKQKKDYNPKLTKERIISIKKKLFKSKLKLNLKKSINIMKKTMT